MGKKVWFEWCLGPWFQDVRCSMCSDASARPMHKTDNPSEVECLTGSRFWSSLSNVRLFDVVPKPADPSVARQTQHDTTDWFFQWCLFHRKSWNRSWQRSSISLGLAVSSMSKRELVLLGVALRKRVLALSWAASKGSHESLVLETMESFWASDRSTLGSPKKKNKTWPTLAFQRLKPRLR